MLHFARNVIKLPLYKYFNSKVLNLYENKLNFQYNIYKKNYLLHKFELSVEGYLNT